MKILTRDFGEIEISETDIVTFETPILGFDEYKKFIFIFDDTVGSEIAWLQSAEEPGLCFILANSVLAKRDYSVKISDDAAQKLGGGAYDIWFVMVAAEEMTKSTVNLRSPVLVNRAVNKAVQFLAEDDFPIRYPLFEKGEKNAAAANKS